jgi:hypothetical protein
VKLHSTIKELKQLISAVFCQPVEKSFPKYLREEIEKFELLLISQNYNLNNKLELSSKLNIINKQFGLSLDCNYFAGRWEKFYGLASIKVFDNSVKSIVIKRDKNQCTYCGFTRQLEVHHVIPQAINGSNSEFNLVCACKICNRSISNSIKLPRNWWSLHPDSRNKEYNNRSNNRDWV